jgi:hypothetical protein
MVSVPQKFASDAITFEAWVSTSDYCHRGEFHVLPWQSCQIAWPLVAQSELVLKCELIANVDG